jgi:hypothetical protein
MKDMFAHNKLDTALEIIQSSVREQLRSSLKIIHSSFREKLGLSLEAPVDENDDISQFSSIMDGTKDWDCFRAFVFGEKELEVRFAQYEVAGYAPDRNLRPSITNRLFR